MLRRKNREQAKEQTMLILGVVFVVTTVALWVLTTIES
jgi:hypothetical protein